MNRRKFLGKIGLIGVGATVAPSVLLEDSFISADVASLAPDFSALVTMIKTEFTPLDTIAHELAVRPYWTRDRLDAQWAVIGSNMALSGVTTPPKGKIVPTLG